MPSLTSVQLGILANSGLLQMFKKGNKEQGRQTQADTSPSVCSWFPAVCRLQCTWTVLCLRVPDRFYFHELVRLLFKPSVLFDLQYWLWISQFSYVFCEKKKTTSFCWPVLCALLRLHFSSLILPSAFPDSFILTQDNFVIFQTCHFFLSLQSKGWLWDLLLPDVLLPNSIKSRSD